MLKCGHARCENVWIFAPELNYSLYRVYDYLITSYGCLGMGPVDKQQDIGVD